MKFIGADNLDGLLRRLEAVGGVDEVAYGEVQKGDDEVGFEFKAKITSQQSFTTGLGWANDRSLLNPDVEVDALKALEAQGYAATIARPVEVRNDGSFAVRGKKKPSPGEL